MSDPGRIRLLAGERIIRTRFDAPCKYCRASIRLGDPVAWMPGRQGIRCVDEAECQARSQERSRARKAKRGRPRRRRLARYA
jgi:hypothetical protein